MDEGNKVEIYVIVRHMYALEALWSELAFEVAFRLSLVFIKILVWQLEYSLWINLIAKFTCLKCLIRGIFWEDFWLTFFTFNGLYLNHVEF